MVSHVFNPIFWIVTLHLLVFCHTTPVQPQQVVLSSTTHGDADRTAFNRNHSARFNITFDDIDLGQKANQSLTSFSFLEYKRFEVLNTTSAAEQGLIARNDIDCASSQPNAIHSVLGSYPGPSIFKSNATALAAINLTEYYDLTSFVVKPLGPLPGNYAFVSVVAWETDGKIPRSFHNLTVIWGLEGEYCGPVYVEPRLYFEGWGEKVNWVEMQASDEDGESVEFCVDDIVLDFYEKLQEDEAEL